MGIKETSGLLGGGGGGGGGEITSEFQNIHDIVRH